MEREREKPDDQKDESTPDDPPVDGPGTGADDDGLGDTSQDSPGHD